jgi:4-hydroxybenzoate polyprenyltransferase
MRAWLRLIRLPNLATAVADSLAGFLVCAGVQQLDWLPPAACWAIAASACLYAAGMILNDVFDVDLDRAERPERPLPSGVIGLPTAALAGHGLLSAGVAAAVAAAVVRGQIWPAVTGAILAAAVWLYDRHLKHHIILGPATMGACRGLNWLLGMTAAGGPFADQWLLPVGMGVYVAGITLFARHEASADAGAGKPADSAMTALVLRAGAATMILGLAIAAGPVWQAAGAGRPLPGSPVTTGNWLLLWGIIAASVLVRALPALVTPEPKPIRAAVGNAIMSIITLDAILVLAYAGERWAVVVLALLVWFVLGKRIVPPT